MARPSKYVSRADLKWGTTGAGRATPKSGLVVHYDSADQNLANRPHADCVAYWNRTRAFHRGPSRGWADIGYSFMACAHGYVLEGRGLGRVQAAQPGGNSTHYSVTLATGPKDPITDLQINAVRELRRWLVDDHGNHGRVLGHRDFISTSCPGDKAYALVKNGTFTKAPGPVTGGRGEMDIIGLKEGDGKNDGLKEHVIYLQRMLHWAGVGDRVGKVDGHWMGKTTSGIKALRESLGTEATDFKRITGTAAYQIQLVATRKEIERRAGSGGGSLPSTERVQITGTVELKR